MCRFGNIIERTEKCNAVNKTKKYYHASRCGEPFLSRKILEINAQNFTGLCPFHPSPSLYLHDISFVEITECNGPKGPGMCLPSCTKQHHICPVPSFVHNWGEITFPPIWDIYPLHHVTILATEQEQTTGETGGAAWRLRKRYLLKKFRFQSQ